MIVWSLLSLALAACSNASEYVSPNCASVGGLPALAVLLVDARSGETTPFYAVKVVARSSTFADSAMKDSLVSESVLAHGSTVRLLRDHPGTYELEITAAGYKAVRGTVTTRGTAQCARTDTIPVPMVKP